MSNTVYLITGANRGLGLHLAQALLSRPSTTVVATSRTGLPSTITSHPNSTLIPVTLDVGDVSGDSNSYQALRKILADEHKIHHIDVLIANAGESPAYESIDTVKISDMLSAFTVNTLGPLMLLQTFVHSQPAKEINKDLEKKTTKFIVISSILGTIGGQTSDLGPVLVYGTSKAAVNYLVKKAHWEFKHVVAVAIHPGKHHIANKDSWVQTAMGQSYADAIKYKEPPMTIEQSVLGMLEQIDAATKETSSGKFIDYKGEEIPW